MCHFIVTPFTSAMGFRTHNVKLRGWLKGFPIQIPDNVSTSLFFCGWREIKFLNFSSNSFFQLASLGVSRLTGLVFFYQFTEANFGKRFLSLARWHNNMERTLNRLSFFAYTMCCRRHETRKCPLAILCMKEGGWRSKHVELFVTERGWHFHAVLTNTDDSSGNAGGRGGKELSIIIIMLLSSSVCILHKKSLFFWCVTGVGGGGRA